MKKVFGLVIVVCAVFAIAHMVVAESSTPSKSELTNSTQWQEMRAVQTKMWELLKKQNLTQTEKDSLLALQGEYATKRETWLNNQKIASGKKESAVTCGCPSCKGSDAQPSQGCSLQDCAKCPQAKTCKENSSAKQSVHDDCSAQCGGDCSSCGASDCKDHTGASCGFNP